MTSSVPRRTSFAAESRQRVDADEDLDEKDQVLKEVLDELLPEAFAVAREAGWRVLKMRHFDVQLIGGAVLHAGRIAEMKTGEGKTLVATLPVYLNALLGARRSRRYRERLSCQT